jgi:hypothetical protein
MGVNGDGGEFFVNSYSRCGPDFIGLGRLFLVNVGGKVMDVLAPLEFDNLRGQ